MKHEIVQFDNGSYSLRSPKSGEAMHSKVGAWEEARQIYVQGTGLRKRFEQGGAIIIYDLGLGIAANALAAYECFLESNPSSSMSIFSFESDLDGLRSAVESETLFPFLQPHRDLLLELLREGLVQRPNFTWQIFEGNYLELQDSKKWEALSPADFIFYDFYSPDTDEHLWSEECFKKLRAKLNRNGILATYACRKMIIKNLILAGFYVGEGRGTSAKKFTTLAIGSDFNPIFLAHFKALDETWLERLQKSKSVTTQDQWERLRKCPQFDKSPLKMTHRIDSG